jgi:hypothetical protein
MGLQMICDNSCGLVESLAYEMRVSVQLKRTWGPAGGVLRWLASGLEGTAARVENNQRLRAALGLTAEAAQIWAQGRPRAPQLQ